jgi:hypothetical protein
MRARPLDAIHVAALLLVALVAGACTFSAEPPARTSTEGPAGTVAGVVDPVGAPSDASPTPAFGAPDQLFGSFRRGSVPVPPDVLGAAVAACRDAPPLPDGTTVGERRVVVSDMRGQGRVLAVFADEAGAVACRIDVADDGTMRATLVRDDGNATDRLAEDDLVLDGMEYVLDTDAQLVLAVGRAGSRAAHVRAGFDDDTYVTASLQDGWWAMWWPGSTRPAIIVAGNNRNEAIANVAPR